MNTCLAPRCLGNFVFSSEGEGSGVHMGVKTVTRNSTSENVVKRLLLVVVVVVVVVVVAAAAVVAVVAAASSSSSSSSSSIALALGEVVVVIRMIMFSDTCGASNCKILQTWITRSLPPEVLHALPSEIHLHGYPLEGPDF